MKKLIGLTLWLISAVANASLIIDPPLGLVWGSSIKDFASKFESVNHISDENERIQSFILRSPQSGIKGFDFYSASVDEKEGLVTVEMLQYFEGDKNGVNIVKRYLSLKEALRKKYGEIDSIDFTSKPSPMFYKCISHDSCGSMATFVDGDNAKIQLLVMADSKVDSGKIVLIYRSNKYSEIKDLLKANKEKKHFEEINIASDEISESL
jgi:hypothetical protein